MLDGLVRSGAPSSCGTTGFTLEILNTRRQNPFLTDTCTEATVASTAACVQGNAWATILEVVESVSEMQSDDGGVNSLGRQLLLTSPQAGFGKSHLLGRLRHEAGAKWMVMPIQIDLERPLSWSASLDQVLHHCHAVASNTGDGITLLSELTRRLFAALNADLIRRGLVQCGEDQQKTLDALENRAVEIYRLTDTGSSLGQWFVRNFESLMPALSDSLVRSAGIPSEPATEWLRVLCAYEQGHADSVSARWQSLQWGIRQITQAMQGGFNDGVQVLSVTAEGEQLSAKHRLIEFLRLTGTVRTPIIAVDGIDVLYRDVKTSLGIADLLTQLAERTSRSVTVLSVNDDVWNSGFRHHLPSALIDRLRACSIRMAGLDSAEAVALAGARLEHSGLGAKDVERFVVLSGLEEWVKGNPSQVSPRAVLRYCASRWHGFTAAPADSQMESSEPPSLFPAGDPALAVAPKFSQPRAANGLKPLKPLMKDELHAESNPVQEAFDLRVDELAETFELDPVRIAALMRIAGQQFPMVQYDEESVPSGNGAPPTLVGLWRTGDSELLFGLRPYDERGYWTSLVRFAASRTSAASKLAIFDNADRMRVSDFLEDQGNSHIDVVELDDASVRRLSAASDLLDDAESGVLPVPVPQVLAGIVDELEFFWKRVTRSPK